MTTACFHCGEVVPKGLDLTVNINNDTQPMCCIGCHAVASAIVENGLQDYYRFRTEKGQKADDIIPEGLKTK